MLHSEFQRLVIEFQLPEASSPNEIHKTDSRLQEVQISKVTFQRRTSRNWISAVTFQHTEVGYRLRTSGSWTLTSNFQTLRIGSWELGNQLPIADHRKLVSNFAIPGGFFPESYRFPASLDIFRRDKFIDACLRPCIFSGTRGKDLDDGKLPGSEQNAPSRVAE